MLFESSTCLIGQLSSFSLVLRTFQSALTGESLPVTKGPGDGVYSGSTCKQGEIEAVVIATGVHTFFGKAAHLVDTTNQVGHFQKVTPPPPRSFIVIHTSEFRISFLLYFFAVFFRS